MDPLPTATTGVCKRPGSLLSAPGCANQRGLSDYCASQCVSGCPLADLLCVLGRGLVGGAAPVIDVLGLYRGKEQWCS